MYFAFLAPKSEQMASFSRSCCSKCTRVAVYSAICGSRFLAALVYCAASIVACTASTPSASILTFAASSAADAFAKIICNISSDISSSPDALLVFVALASSAAASA
jgi:hypothetical protein